MLKRILFFLGGLWILSLGIVLILRSNLGTGSWDTVFVGFYEKFGLTFGSWVFIVSFFVMLLNAILLKEKPEWLSLPVVFLNGAAIDFWNEWALSSFKVSSVPYEIVSFVLGIFLLSFGIVLYLKGNFSKAPLDGLMIAISKRFSLPYGPSRAIGETVACVIGYSAGGPVGIGTFVIMVFMGFFIQLNVFLLKKVK